MLLDLNVRPRELGRLRMGEKGSTVKNGKTVTFPKRRSEWRLTSEDKELLEAAAELYGGTVREWTDAPTEAKQWELPTDSDSIDVLVPSPAMANPISQFYEMWSGGGCARRCNGEVEMLTGQGCLCPKDFNERIALAAKGKACQPVTRLMVFLPRLPDIGVWRVEAHGYNAAVELPASAGFLARFAARDQWIKANLTIQTRTKRKDGKTTHFVVPILSTPDVPLGALLAGTKPPEQIGNGDQPALNPGDPDSLKADRLEIQHAISELTPEQQAVLKKDWAAVPLPRPTYLEADHMEKAWELIGAVEKSGEPFPEYEEPYGGTELVS